MAQDSACWQAAGIQTVLVTGSSATNATSPVTLPDSSADELQVSDRRKCLVLEYAAMRHMAGAP